MCSPYPQGYGEHDMSTSSQTTLLRQEDSVISLQTSPQQRAPGPEAASLLPRWYSVQPPCSPSSSGPLFSPGTRHALFRHRGKRGWEDSSILSKSCQQPLLTGRKLSEHHGEKYTLERHQPLKEDLTDTQRELKRTLSHGLAEKQTCWATVWYRQKRNNKRMPLFTFRSVKPTNKMNCGPLFMIIPGWKAQTTTCTAHPI